MCLIGSSAYLTPVLFVLHFHSFSTLNFISTTVLLQNFWPRSISSLEKVGLRSIFSACLPILIYFISLVRVTAGFLSRALGKFLHSNRPSWAAQAKFA